MIENSPIWLGSRESWDLRSSVLSQAIKMLSSGQVTPSMRDSMDEECNPVGYEVVAGKVAVVSVVGSTMTRTSWMSRYFEIPTYDDIRQRVIQAADDQNIGAIALSLDTSGGQSGGVAKLGRFISQINDNVKPIVTFNAGSIASAGLWYGTGVSQVVSDEFSKTGSLGVVLIHTEWSKFMQELGETVTVLATSPYKAVGNPYEALSDFAKKALQEEIDQLHVDFVKAVATNRKMTPEDVQAKVATGKMYSAKDAMKLGIVDRVLSFDETIARLVKATPSRKL